MEFKKRLEALLILRQEEIERYINSLIGNDLRGSIFSDDILNEVVRYTLEREERFHDCNDSRLWGFLLWKSKMQVSQRALSIRKAMKRSQTLEATSNQKGESVERLHAASPSLLLHREDKKFSVRQYVEMLSSSDQKNALKLVRLQGFSLKEAAQVMGKSPDAVEKLVKRGFAQLVHIMKAKGAAKYLTTGTTS